MGPAPAFKVIACSLSRRGDSWVGSAKTFKYLSNKCSIGTGISRCLSDELTWKSSTSKPRVCLGSTYWNAWTDVLLLCIYWSPNNVTLVPLNQNDISCVSQSTLHLPNVRSHSTPNIISICPNSNMMKSAVSTNDWTVNVICLHIPAPWTVMPAPSKISNVLL